MLVVLFVLFWEDFILFKCDGCKKITQSGESAFVFPLLIRNTEYLQGVLEQGVFFAQRFTRGEEIVKEGKFCTACALGIKKPKVHFVTMTRKNSLPRSRKKRRKMQKFFK